MIDEKTLRIGNTVIACNLSVQIRELHKEHAVLKGVDPKTCFYTYDYASIHPIHLTKELLIERGFTMLDNVGWIEIDGLYIQVNIVDGRVLLAEVDAEDVQAFYLPRPCHHLHTIENIVFVNTDKELTKAATA